MALKSETWTGSNGDPWPAQWDTSSKSVGSTADIQTNKGRFTTSAAGGYTDFIYAHLGDVAADIVLTVDITVTDVGEAFLYVFVRGDASDNRVYAQLSFETGFGFVLLGRHDLGSPTTLNQVSQAFSLNDVVHLKFTTLDTLLQLSWWLNGAGEPATPQIWRTEPLYTTNTKVSLLKFGGNAASAHTSDLDDLVIEAAPITGRRRPTVFRF